MKKALLFSVAATLICSLSLATIRRVGYAGLQLTGIDYSSMQPAIDASAAGDTIQVYGSQSGTVSKRLVIIGFGYNLDVHPTLQAIGTHTPSNVSLTLGAGSDGTIVTGVSGIYTIYDASNAHTTIAGITFQRCYGSFNLYNNSGYGLISNIKIVSSVITSGGMPWSADADYPVNNLQVFNCIVYGFTLYKAGTTASFINCATPSPDLVGNYAIALNNASALVKNSIIGGAGTATNINTVYENNLFAEAQPAQLPAGSNNKWGQTWTSIFNGATSNMSYMNNAEFDENYYALKAGSPAINGGINGAGQATNCGIFGGEAIYVYRLSGIPAIPSFYKISAPSLSATTNPYNVTISVRSNN